MNTMRIQLTRSIPDDTKVLLRVQDGDAYHVDTVVAITTAMAINLDLKPGVKVRVTEDFVTHLRITSDSHGDHWMEVRDHG
jgi:hypothetical protein